jgi:hypothetical protein
MMNFHLPQQEKMEHMLQDQTSHIHHVGKGYEEENQHLVLKIRDTRDELLWYKVID